MKRVAMLVLTCLGAVAAARRVADARRRAAAWAAHTDTLDEQEG